jgi:hypothetical protein
MHSSSYSFVLHALPISASFTWSLHLYLAKNTSYEAPHYAAFSNLLSLHLSLVEIFSSAPCSQTIWVYVPLLMSEPKFCTHTETGKIIILYILMFTFIERRREDRRFWIEWWQALPEFNLPLISFWIKFWFLTVIPKYLNCDIFSKDMFAIVYTMILPCIKNINIKIKIIF